MRLVKGNLLPQGAGVLFFTQIFSTLSYSVLYSTLILYLTEVLHLSKTHASTITGFFIAFNYALHLIGGYLGGRFLSYRSLFIFSMFLQVLGCLFLTKADINALYWGLAFFLTGSGLNVTCINCMLTQRFEAKDKRREAAFLWNYSGMNLGFLIGFSLGGYFQLVGNYALLFFLSSLGNAIALGLVLLNWSSLKDKNTILSSLAEDLSRKRAYQGIGIILLMVPLLYFMGKQSLFANQLVMITGIITAFFLVSTAYKQKNKRAQKRLYAFIVLMLAGLVFWTLYLIAPMGLTLFIKTHVDRQFYQWLIPPQWLSNINTIVIVLGGPIMSLFLSRLREKGLKISIPLQFSIALALIGFAYLALALGISVAGWHLVTLKWIVLCYVLQSIGELLLSPIGYAMVGQLVPDKMQGIMMGAWMMVTGVAATFSSYFSHKMITVGGSLVKSNVLGFKHIFNLVGTTAVLAGVVLFLTSRFIVSLMEGKQENGLIRKGETLEKLHA